MRTLLPVLFLLLTFTGCVRDPWGSADASGLVDAFVPVYARPSGEPTVQFTAPLATKKAGKIYVFGRYLFQNELNEGIHVIDNADRSDPKKVGFYKIPFTTEFAVRGNYIYANSINDMLVIDVNSPLQPSIVKVLKNAFPLVPQTHPSGQGFFECVDPAKGIVVDWEVKQIPQPACRR